MEFFAIDFYGSCSEPFRNRFELTSCLASEQRRNNRICPENKHERTIFTHPHTRLPTWRMENEIAAARSTKPYHSHSHIISKPLKSAYTFSSCTFSIDVFCSFVFLLLSLHVNAKSVTRSASMV